MFSINIYLIYNNLDDLWLLFSIKMNQGIAPKGAKHYLCNANEKVACLI